MELARAQEIIKAENRIDVKWNGIPVWIESIDPQKRTATIYPEENKKDHQTVNVMELQEV